MLWLIPNGFLSDKMANDSTPPKPAQAPPVTEIGWKDIATLMNPGSEKRQTMRGFDERIVDIVDYHIRGTHWIWEERGVGRIYNQYRHNTPVWHPHGVSYGRDQVISDTLQMQHTFPDRRAFGDDVMWRVDEEEQTYHFSARITNLAHHWGHGPLGPPTGRRIHWSTLCNCITHENRIAEEWLIRDETAVVRQLGLDPWELARTMARQEAEWSKQDSPSGDLDRLSGQNAPQVHMPKSGDFDVEDFVRGFLHDAWNVRLLNRVRECCAPNILLHLPGQRELYGTGDYTAHVTGLLAQFPDAQLLVDDLYWNPDRAKGGFKLAVRWTLQGTHEGWGAFGSPTGRSVSLMGLSHLYVRNETLVEDYTLYSEIALMKQLVALE